MKTTIWIITFFIVANVIRAQTVITGKYRDHLGSHVELRSDSSFKYEWHFDLTSSWTTGTWSNHNDTIIFSIKLVYDTLRLHNEIPKKETDTLVLSLDEKIDILSPEEYALTKITSGQQNGSKMPEKLFYKKGRLYNIDLNGKIVTKKIRVFGSNKKYEPWYVIQ